MDAWRALPRPLILLPNGRTANDLDKVVRTNTFSKCRPDFAGIYLQILSNLTVRFIQWQTGLRPIKEIFGNLLLTRCTQGNLAQEKCFGLMEFAGRHFSGPHLFNIS